MSELDKFLEERSKILIETGVVARTKLLAKELVMGYDRGLWEYVGNWVGTGSPHPPNDNVKAFFSERWVNWNYHDNMRILRDHGYTFLDDPYEKLTDKALVLVDETEPYNIFISYKRSESSALALLVLARLKEHDLEPFVDMALEAGGIWHADLKQKIEENDYFIVLLGKDTLSSEITVKEICWAIDSNRTIIPIWHNRFGLEEDFDLAKQIDGFASHWQEEKLRQRKGDVEDVISRTNAIRVLDESASGYNTAIVELLNRFDITP